jgi:tetratricopeptide (TPR) repeat protein
MSVVLLLYIREAGSISSLDNLEWIDAIAVLDCSKSMFSDLKDWAAKNGKKLVYKTDSYSSYEKGKNRLFSLARKKLKNLTWYLLWDLGDECKIVNDKWSLDANIDAYRIPHFTSEMVYREHKLVKSIINWTYRGIRLDIEDYKDTDAFFINIYQPYDKRLSQEPNLSPLERALLLKDSKEFTEAYSIFKKIDTLSAPDNYHISMGMAECCLNTSKTKEALYHLHRAYEFETRAEPLVKLGEIYMNKKEWHIAFLYLEKAIDIPMPQSVMPVNYRIYDYRRWHVMGIIAYYCCKYDIGRIACKNAIETSITEDEKSTNKNNLSYYK